MVWQDGGPPPEGDVFEVTLRGGISAEIDNKTCFYYFPEYFVFIFRGKPSSHGGGGA